jgi:hypothetical protein
VPAAAPRPGAAQEQAVQPPRGVAGTTFTFYATGFDDDARVVFWATAPDGQIVGDNSYRTRTNDAGRADWEWVAPATATPGTWTMVAQQGERAETARTIPFEIVPVGQAENLPPDVDSPAANNRDVVPNVGAPGSRFTFFATGFKRKEIVGFWFNAPDGSVYSNTTDWRVRASDGGRADWLWTAPGDVPLGIWQAVAQGNESGTTRTIFFEIRALEDVPPETTQRTDVGVEPAVGEPDTTFAFFATGFAPDERVSFWAVAPDGDIKSSNGFRVRSTNDGRADWAWYAEKNVLPGEWQMVAFGNRSEITKVIFFTIRPTSD